MTYYRCWSNVAYKHKHDSSGSNLVDDEMHVRGAQQSIAWCMSVETSAFHVVM